LCGTLAAQRPHQSPSVLVFANAHKKAICFTAIFHIFFISFIFVIACFAWKHGNCSHSCEEYERSAANHRPQSFVLGNDGGCNPFSEFKSQTGMTRWHRWRIPTFHELSDADLSRSAQHAVSGEARKIKPGAGCLRVRPTPANANVIFFTCLSRNKTSVEWFFRAKPDNRGKNDILKI
jgi:hypothetical protein